MIARVALVTGSSRGIGRAIALQLARESYRVVVNYYDNPQEDAALIAKNQEEARQVLQEIEAAGGSGIVVGADVSDPLSVRELLEAVVKEYGQIDVLVNNAGINKDQLILRIDDEEWDKLINTNLSSAFYCCRAALKQMIRKRYGRIINISSVVGLSGNAGQTHYSASKAGLLGLTFSIAREYGARGITANVIAPGYIQSEMTAGFTPEQRERMLSSIALGRMGTPEDIAGVVAFLASDAAAYITAQVIKVDGGLS